VVPEPDSRDANAGTDRRFGRHENARCQAGVLMCGRCWPRTRDVSRADPVSRHDRVPRRSAGIPDQRGPKGKSAGRLVEQVTVQTRDAPPQRTTGSQQRHGSTPYADARRSPRWHLGSTSRTPRARLCWPIVRPRCSLPDHLRHAVGARQIALRLLHGASRFTEEYGVLWATALHARIARCSDYFGKGTVAAR